MPVAVLLTAVAAVAAAMFAPGAAPATPVQAVTVVNTYPHDASSFCQGLVYHEGTLLEGTGQYRQSKLRRVAIKSGKPTANVDLPDDVFGEGVTVWNDTVVQLTWQNGYLITYDDETLRRTGTVALSTIDRGLREGWGITHDGQHLIISDGTSTLRFVDPNTFRMIGQIRVKDGFRSVSRLNELEYVNGEILANVWYRDQIARINPQTGRVIGWLDLEHLRPRSVRRNREAALNGIAWDPTGKRLFVTGKNWPSLYEIRF